MRTIVWNGLRFDPIITERLFSVRYGLHSTLIGLINNEWNSSQANILRADHGRYTFKVHIATDKQTKEDR
jgi:hypothetical protein